MKILLLVLQKIREERETLLLVAQVAQPAMVSGVDGPACSPTMAHSTEERPPVSGGGHHLASQAGPMGFACVSDQRSMSPVDVSQRVLNTIAETRAPSTMWLYALKWKVFSAWCAAKNERHVFHIGDPGFIARPARCGKLAFYIESICDSYSCLSYHY